MSTLDAVQDLYHPIGEAYLPFQGVDIHRMDEILNTGTGVLNANEMGTGKTIEACGLINLRRPRNVVIICPNNLRHNWLNELKRWVEPRLFEELSCGEVEMCLPTMYMHGVSNLVIVSFEGLTRWVRILRELDPDLIFIDEGHFLKNPGTKRAKALLELRRWATKTVIMTGTPIPNYPYELFNLINFLSPEQWKSRSEFETRYCPYKNKYAYHMDELQDYLRHGKVVNLETKMFEDLVFDSESLTPGPLVYRCILCNFQSDARPVAEQHMRDNYSKGAEGHQIEARQSARALLKMRPVQRTKTEKIRKPGVMIRRLKKEVLPELPRKRRQIIELPAEGRLLELVLKEKEMFEQALRADAELNEILTGDIAEDDSTFEQKIERLRFTRKYFFDEISIIRHELAKAKVPYVIEHIEEILESKEKLVCFIHHRDVGEAIRDHFTERAVLIYGGMAQHDIYAGVQRFNTSEACELFIGSLKMAGVGLNLQVASNIVFAELDWVPGTITQAEDRCHRIGQEHSLLIQHLVAYDSMDSNMAQRIIRKQKTINAALNAPART